MFRRYNRWHSRFDQPDPSDGSYDLSDPQSFNRYAYTRNDPVNFVDPSGLAMNDSFCGAEFSFAECGGSAGFWGGSFGGNVARHNREYGGMPANIASAMAAHDQGVREAIHNASVAAAVRAAIAARNWTLADALLSGNPNVGIQIGNLKLWGQLGGAFVSGYGAASEIAGVRVPIRNPIAYGIYKALKLMQKTRGPDFLIVNGAAGLQVSYGLALRGASLEDAVTGFGVSTPEASIFVGWLWQLSTPRAEDVTGFLSRVSFSLDIFWNPRTGVGAGAGLGVMYSPFNQGAKSAIVVGAGAGGGFSGGYGWPDVFKKLRP